MKRASESKTNKLVGSALRELRLEAGMSQAYLGELIGIDATAVTRIESGTRAMTLHEARVLGQIVTFTLDDVLGLKGGDECPCHEVRSLRRQLAAVRKAVA